MFLLELNNFFSSIGLIFYIEGGYFYMVKFKLAVNDIVDIGYVLFFYIDYESYMYVFYLL